MDPPVLEYMESRIGFPLLEHTIFMDRLLSVLEAPVSIYDPALIANPENEIQVFFERERRHDISEILQGIGITSSVKLVRLPLVIEESLLGILWLWGEGASRSDLPILSLFAKQVSTSLERARLFQEVQNLAITDPLTGLHNRRSLYELGKIEFARADRFHRPYSCLMLDIDHFKQINDSHGHHAGDLVLQEFARLCRKSVRDIDLVGRYGGEELLILMPETSIERAINVAERLRLNVAGYPIPSAGAEITITASIGVAARDENTPDLETLIARADQAMYIAKHRGRNRVAVSK
jgi:diguanylate cyclase (GGDEF)-like protein